MPIQIIDNFDLNAEKAIDNRMVVGPTPSFYHNKNDIPNKYPGLRIWELPGAELGGGATNSTLNGLSYAWTGTQWISENTTAIGGGAANTLRVPYFSAINTILDTDLRYNISDKNFGFSVDPDTGASSPLNNIARIRVDGNVVISGKFIGNAGGLDNGIFNINASNIAVGTMQITRLGGDVGVGYILTSNGINSASYKIPSSINVGSATQLQNPRLIYGNTFNGTADVTGNLVFGQNSGKATILYNQTTARTLIIPSVGGNRTFSFIDQPETITATKTFTANISMTYVGAQPGDPVSLTAQSAYFIGSLAVDSAFNLNGPLTITHTNPSGSGSYTKLKITEGANQWWATFGPEGGSTNANSPRIRTGNSSALNPSYTWRGDENTGLYWPSAGVIGFTSDGVEKMRINNAGVYITSNLDALASVITPVPLTFVANPTPGSSPLVTTPVLSTTATTYFWFGGPYWYLYMDVETGPGTDAYTATHRARNWPSDGSPQNHGGVIVPAGCRVRIFIPAIGGATGNYRKFGYA